MISDDNIKFPSLSIEMDQLLDLVVFLNLENILMDFSSEKKIEKLIFKNSTSAGYFMFQLEILISKWRWSHKIIKLTKNEIIISERV